MISPDAAGIILGQVNVIGQENWKCVWRNSQIIDESVDLRVEPVDVNQASRESEHGTSLAGPRWRTESLFRQNSGSAEQHVISSMALHGSPEVGALIGVNVLRGTHADSARAKWNASEDG